MTAYNREKYIAEAIESVLASTYNNYELIIVDDCSSDNTVKIAQIYAANDNRINIYVNEANLGDYPNRNKAASYAKGVYLMSVDSDDKILPEGILVCLDLMRDFPNCNFAMRVFNGRKEPYFLTPEAIIREHFFENALLVIGPGGTVINREYFNKIGRYPEKYGPANDMYFNLNAASNTDTLLIPVEFQYYRRHEGQELNNKFSYLYNTYLYLKDALNLLKLPLTKVEIQWLNNKNRRRFTTNFIMYFLKTGNLKKSSFALSEARFTFTDFLKGIFH